MRGPFHSPQTLKGFLPPLHSQQRPRILLLSLSLVRGALFTVHWRSRFLLHPHDRGLPISDSMVHATSFAAWRFWPSVGRELWRRGGVGRESGDCCTPKFAFIKLGRWVVWSEGEIGFLLCEMFGLLISLWLMSFFFTNCEIV